MNKVLTLPSNPYERAIAFLEEFEAAPNDADIDIHTGIMESGEPAVVVIIDGGKGHGFTTKEARSLAKIAEAAMNDAPNDPRANEFPNLIVMLRMGADKSEAGVARAHSSGERRNG